MHLGVLASEHLLATPLCSVPKRNVWVTWYFILAILAFAEICIAYELFMLQPCLHFHMDLPIIDLLVNSVMLTLGLFFANYFIHENAYGCMFTRGIVSFGYRLLLIYGSRFCNGLSYSCTQPWYPYGFGSYCSFDAIEVDAEAFPWPCDLITQKKTLWFASYSISIYSMIWNGSIYDFLCHWSIKTISTINFTILFVHACLCWVSFWVYNAFQPMHI